MAVAYAFRAGLFNIGGQGQYFAGLFIGVMGRLVARRAARGGCTSSLALVLGTLAGAAVGRDRRLPQGDHRRQRGDHDDHAQLRRAVDRRVGVRPRRAAALGLASDESVPISNAVVGGRAAAGLLGRPGAAGPARRDLHRAGWRSIVFWVLLNRSVAGYEARAVGFNPDAAEYGGIHAGRTYTKVMLICGAFAGLAGVHRHPRLAVRGRDERHPERGRRRRRLHRHRGRAARAQHHERRAVLGAALRRADQRHVRAQPRSGGLPAPAGRRTSR